ncbi:indolepyruvate/phenylpyruvate decarboxylase [Anaeromyxobacter diazotrophicus]|uniref:Indolepyruvate/phenylpyruvate decarboxylase n=1 Tax=Anaeromyxobacter diazotrophicus TaxID=2590199 RepID=A0A7I9VNX0_9BACT|nr:indolepyruvate/phenylpyruvate decarboxylase [Anaeromyxobacter diazotrophicus]GEJ58114.1 indolepyruvate/phenylpyruvate decarboxylase [Anaeromyxobacter diazotrophicus]
MNLTEALLTALRERGARQIFGIPGDFALPFFRILERSALLPLHTLSHEPAVGFAADGAARAGQGLGVAAVTYGAGALNMVNAVAAAYAERSPVVVLSGGPGKREAGSGLLLHHQAKTLDSQFQIYREITCAQVRLDDAARAPADLARALDACQRQSRPVYVELPRDMVAEPCGPVPPASAPALDEAALEACAEEVLARLAGARAPVLMAGIEVRRFGLEEKVAELARRLAIPTVTSLMGRGLLAHADAPLLGTYMGVAGDPRLTERVETSDALFLLGEIVCDTNFAASERRIDLRRTLHAWEGEVTLGYHVYPDVPLPALVDALLARTPPSARHFEPERPVHPRGLVADGAPLTPTDVATALNDLMAAHGKLPIAADMGDCFFTAMDVDQTALVAPGYYATMGFGVPAAFGVQAATGRRPVVLVGDGAFQMTGWELGNCRRNGWDPIVLVLNNRSWEMLRTFQPESSFNDLDDWRFAEVAPALGGDGVRVSTRAELAAALERARVTRGRFQLIDCVIPRGVLSQALSRFVAGVRRLGAGG